MIPCLNTDPFLRSTGFVLRLQRLDMMASQPMVNFDETIQPNILRILTRPAFSHERRPPLTGQDIQQGYHQ